MNVLRCVRLAGLVCLLAASSSASEPYSTTEMCSTSSNSVGTGVVLTLEGVVAGHPERARAVGGPAGKFGALIYGSVAANPPLPWGNGTLCIAPFHPSNGRYSVRAFSAIGEVDVMMDGTGDPTLFPFGPGETGCFQYLYRDTQGWNLSNALVVTMAP